MIKQVCVILVESSAFKLLQAVCPTAILAFLGERMSKNEDVVKNDKTVVLLVRQLSKRKVYKNIHRNITNILREYYKFTKIDICIE